MKKWIKITGFSIFLLLAAVIGIHCFPAASVAKQGILSLKAPDTINVGETFTVVVQIESDIPLAAIDAIVTYDAAVVEFVGNEDGKMTGSQGVLNLSDLFATETNSRTYGLTFQAMAVGDAKFAFGETYVTDYADLEPIEIHSSTDVIEIRENQTLSDNAYLKELLVATGSLNQSFDKNTFAYSVDVEADCDTFIFSSVPEDENAVVTVDKPYTLMHEENIITITVTAPSGNTCEYVIKVNRK